MNARRTLFSQLEQHCTSLLLSRLSDADIEGINCNTWDITESVEDYEILKIAFVFERLGGLLKFNGRDVEFAEIANWRESLMFSEIYSFWDNTVANGDVPVFDVGSLKVPSLLPKFVASERPDGAVIERLTNGEYIPIEGARYQSLEKAEKEAKNLNVNYKEEGD